MPAISRIPPNLNPEEKLAFVRERNRLKTQRLRARRREKIQEEQQLVSSQNRESLGRGGAGESSGSSSSASGESEEREEEAKGRPGKVRKLMGNEAEKEVELELVVERMKRKLVELGVGEEDMRRMLTGYDEPPEQGLCSIDDGQNVSTIPTSSRSPSPSSSPSSSSSSSPSQTSLSNSVAFFGGETWWTRQPFPSPSPMLPLDTNWRSTLFSMHREALLSYRTGAISHDHHTTTVSDSALASMQISILRLLVAVSGSESQTAYKSSSETIPPTADVFEYLASHPVDERLMLVPSGPVTKMRVSKAVASGIIDISSVIGEVILSAVIRGDVFDLSGWTLSSSFWTTFRLLPKPPRENVFEARPVDVEGGPMSPFPPTLRGSSILEIVLGTERPGSRTRGPFPLQGPLRQQKCIVASSS